MTAACRTRGTVAVAGDIVPRLAVQCNHSKTRPAASNTIATLMICHSQHQASCRARPFSASSGKSSFFATESRGIDATLRSASESGDTPAVLNSYSIRGHTTKLRANFGDAPTSARGKLRGHTNLCSEQQFGDRKTRAAGANSWPAPKHPPAPGRKKSGNESSRMIVTPGTHR